MIQEPVEPKIPLSLLIRGAGLEPCSTEESSASASRSLIGSDVIVTSLTDDSRRVTSGSCFVAVRGTTFDGHRFLDAAVRAGASALVVEKDATLPLLPPGVAVVRVADTQVALARLAATWYGVDARSAADMLLLGVTGTNGKTTTAYLLRSILAAAGLKPAMMGTVEYDLVGRTQPAPLTTPAALDVCRALAEARRAGAKSAAMEVSSHALAQRRCDGLRFAAAIFTNLTGDHLDYHGTIEAYFAAKRRLFEMLDSRATAVVNITDPRGADVICATVARVRTFGLPSRGDRADVTAEVLRLDATGSEFVIKGLKTDLRINSRLIGAHNVLNILGAATAADAVGVSIEAIGEGIEQLRGVPGRLQRADSDDVPFRVFVDYAHTDDALDNVLAALAALKPARLICVFGCGGDRDRTKRPRMAAAALRWSRIVVITSDNPRTEAPDRIIEEILAGVPADARDRVIVEPDRRLAIARALETARAGDTVVIAGKGHENYQIIGCERRHFDDVEEARECLRKLAGLTGAAA